MRRAFIFCDQLLNNYIIGQLNRLTAISQPMKAAKKGDKPEGLAGGFLSCVNMSPLGECLLFIQYTLSDKT